MESDGLPVIVFPHPFQDARQDFRVAAGQTVRAIIGQDALPAVVVVDGVVIEPEQWAEVVPTHSMVIRRVPQGDVGRILGTIAVLALAAWAGGAFGLGLATSLTAGPPTATAVAAATAGITAGVTVVGSLALNALIPPTLPGLGGGQGGSIERLASISGLSNRVTPYAPIPVLYGKRTFYPPIPMTALPYTELVGRDQYVRAMFVLGYGPMEIGGVTVGAGESLLTESTSLTGTPIKIGGTSIDQFEDVEFEIGDPDDLTLYTDSITEQVVGVALNEQNTPTAIESTLTDGNSVTRTTEPDADEFSVELFSPALFTFTEDGDTVWARVRFRVEYSPAGAGAWTTAIASWSIGSRERKSVREGRRFTLPSRGEYDIRITRIDTYYQRIASHATDFTWTVLRSITRDRQPFDVENVVAMAIRIRATDQLSGRIDRLSVEATRVVQAHDGTSWGVTATRSPAWAYVDALTGNATKTPKALADVDAAALKSWADWCDTNGLTFDAYLQQDQSVFDRARDIAAAGLATWSIQDDGTIGVARDISGQTPKMLISPRVSSGFSLERRYQELPHALRVQFIDDVTGEPVERLVFDDGYDASTATRFEQLQLVGVTDPDQAWKLARYHLAQARLRPEAYRWRQDVQHLIFERGDLVEINHDVMVVGLAFARITAVSGADVTLDEQVALESGKTYSVRAQAADGTLETRAIAAPSSGTTAELTLASAFGAVDVGDHVVFGEAGSVVIPARVTEISPAGDLQATVTAVPAAEDIFDAWTGTIPAFNPVITQPVDEDLIAPTIPTILNVESGVTSGAGGAGRQQVVVVTIEVEMPPGLVGVTLEGRFRFRETPSGAGGEITSAWSPFGGGTPSDAGAMLLTDLEPGQVIDVQVRARRADRVSSWSTTTTHTVGTTSSYVRARDVSGLVGGGNLMPPGSGKEQTWTGTFGTTYNVDLDQIGLEAGDSFSLAAELRSATGADAIAFCYEFRDSGGSPVAGGTCTATVESSSYVRRAAEEITIPASTSYLRIYPRNNDATEAAFVRRMMLVRGGVALPFEIATQANGPGIGAKPQHSGFSTTAANSGQIYIHGFDAFGEPDDRDGFVLVGGERVVVPKGVLDTYQHTQGGWIVFETAGTSPFASAGFGGRPYAFAWKSRGQWKYDDGAGGVTDFTPSDTMVIMGTIQTGVSNDSLRYVNVFTEAMSLDVFGEPGATLNEGDFPGAVYRTTSSTSIGTGGDVVEHWTEDRNDAVAELSFSGSTDEWTFDASGSYKVRAALFFESEDAAGMVNGWIEFKDGVAAFAEVAGSRGRFPTPINEQAWLFLSATLTVSAGDRMRIVMQREATGAILSSETGSVVQIERARLNP